MKYNQIYQYIAYLEEAKNTDISHSYINCEGAVVPFIKYAEEVDCLIKCLYDEHLIKQDYDQIIKKYEEIPLMKEENPLEYLEALISKIIIQERFKEGSISENISNGTLLELIKEIQRKDI